MKSISDSVLQEYGDILGTPLFFDEDSQCTLLIEKEIIITIRTNSNRWIFNNLLSLSTHPGNSPETPLRLLELNMMLAEAGAGAIACLPDTQQPIYILSIPIPKSAWEIESSIKKMLTSRKRILENS